MFAVDFDRASCTFESCQTRLLHRHKSCRTDAQQQRFVLLCFLCCALGDGENLVRQGNSGWLIESVGVLLDGLFHLRPEAMAIKELVRVVDLIFQFIVALQQ